MSRRGRELILCVAIVLVGWVARADEPPRPNVPPPLKVEVSVPATPHFLAAKVPFSVELRDAHGRPAPTSTEVKVQLEISGASIPAETHEVRIPAGQSSALLSWQPKVPGVTRVHVREAQDRLLDGGSALLIRKAAPARVIPLPDPTGHPPRHPSDRPPTAKSPKRPGNQGGGPPEATAGLPGDGRGNARADAAKDEGRAATSPPPPKVTPRPTPARGGDDHADGDGIIDAKDTSTEGHFDIQVSARNITGIFADGQESAKVQVFYVSDEGGGVPADVRIWLHWEGGEVSLQPLVMKKGETQVEARWTAASPVEGSIAIKSVSPHVPFAPEVTKVKFVQPVKGFRVEGPTDLSVVEVGELTAYFEDFEGRVISSSLGQSVSFSPEAPSLSVNPAKRSFDAGDALVRVSVMPKTFAGTSRIWAATLGFQPQSHSVRITWMSVLVLSLAGGALGGFMRFLRSRGVLWKRLAVGVVVGTLGVFGYVAGLLPVTTVSFLHNMVAVPVVALLAGWLGLDFLDRADALSLLTGHTRAEAKRPSAVPAPAARP